MSGIHHKTSRISSVAFVCGLSILYACSHTHAKSAEWQPAEKTVNLLKSIQFRALQLSKVRIDDLSNVEEIWNEKRQKMEDQGHPDVPGTFEEWKSRILKHIPNPYKTLPSKYQDPVTYYILSLRIKRISDAANYLDLTDTPHVYYGTVPLGRINAVIDQAQNVENEVVIVFHNGVFNFGNVVSKIVARVLDVRIGKQGQFQLDLAIPELRKNIQADPTIVTDLAEFLIVYAKYAEPGMAHSDVLPKVTGTFSQNLYEAYELFLVGHEYGHVIAEHLSAGAGEKAYLGAEDVSEIIFEQKQELQADAIGLMLTERAIGNENGGLSRALAGATLSFVSEQIICESLSMLSTGTTSRYPENLSHPPPLVRLENLRKIVAYKQDEIATNALEISFAIEGAIDEAWLVVKQRLLRSYQDPNGPRLDQVWYDQGFAEACSDPREN